MKPQPVTSSPVTAERPDDKTFVYENIWQLLLQNRARVITDNGADAELRLASGEVFTLAPHGVTRLV